jgi:hypothetical protein
MLRPSINPLRPSGEPIKPASGYFLTDVSLEIPSSDTAVFRARLHGPPGAPVWTRAWLSTEVDGTLAEVASPRLSAGDAATLTVTLRDQRVPEFAWIRIESAPLKTEQVVGIALK